MHTRTKTRPNEPKLRMAGSNILVRYDQAEPESAGGILIPEQAREKATVGTVLLVGPGCRDPKTGVRKPLDVEEGDRVMVSRYTGTEVEFGGAKFKVHKQADVVCVVGEQR